MKTDHDDVTLLSAYMDEELAPEEAEQVRQRLEQDEAFADLLAELKRANVSLKQALDSIDSQPLPKELESLLAEPSNAVDTPASSHDAGNTSPHHTNNVVPLFKSQRDVRKRALKRRLPQFSAASVAASVLLVVGVIALFNFMPFDNSSLTLAANQPTPEPVGKALTNLVAGGTQQLPQGTLSEALAFRHQDGRLCKQFTMNTEQTAWNAVACWDNQRWMNEAVAAQPKAASDSDFYRPAAGSTGGNVDEYIEQNIQGVALSTEDERQAIGAQRKGGL